MTPSIFRFYLKPDATSWYYLNAAGVVSVSVTPVPLNYAPVGWNDVKLSWSRGEKRWGLTRAFTTPLGFIKDAAKILRKVFAAAGAEGKALLSIEKLQTYNLTHSPFYEGELDFSNHTDTDTQVQTNVMEGGLSEMLRKRDNIPYQIPIYGPDVTPIQNDGIVLGQYELLTFLAGPIVTSLLTPKIERSYAENPIGIDTIEHEVYGTNNSVGDLMPQYPFFRATANGVATVRLKGEIEVDAGGPYIPAHGLQVAVVKVPFDGSPNVRYTYSDQWESYHLLHRNFDVTHNIPIAPGDELYLLSGVYSYQSGTNTFIWATDGQHVITWHILAGTMEMTYSRRNPTYQINSYTYLQVFQKLIEALTGGQFTGASTFLSDINNVQQGNRPAYTMVTCGDAIRGLNGANLKITLGELLQDAWSRWGLAIGPVNGVARLEPLSYFFQDTLIAHLGAPTDVKMRPATEFMGNSAKFGYQDQNYGDLYGKDEFNVGMVYSLPVTRIQKELDFVSPWRADMYGIETLSRNLSGKEKQDASSDNDTFLIEVEYNVATSRWIPYRPNNASNTAGLISPDSAYNLMLSPGRSARRVLPIIRSFLEPVQGPMVWQTSDKNQRLETSFPSEGSREETDDLIMDDTTAPLVFKPYWVEFDSSISDSISAGLMAVPNGYFTFDWRGSLWKAFAWNVDVKPALHEKQTVKLLAHPTTDLSLSVI